MIHFVGAGPGALDLITVRGRELIRNAQIIIYAGSLVNKDLLREAEASCELHDSAYMDLGQVLAVMKEGYAQGRRIVRLHTGDPSIYGAIREQMDLLAAEGVPYEVCPGVSSFCAAAAALKVEYTLPDITQTVIISRAEGRTAVPEKESLAALSRHRATLILFLSVSMADKVQQELTREGGYDMDTPAAVVYKASWEEERIIRGSLRNLPEMIADNQIKKTALIIVGECFGKEYALSKLYDKDFSTEYRRAADPVL